VKKDVQLEKVFAILCIMWRKWSKSTCASNKFVD